MIKEIGHFVRNGKEVARLQKQYPRAEFSVAFQRFDTVLPAFPMRRVKAHKA